MNIAWSCCYLQLTRSSLTGRVHLQLDVVRITEGNEIRPGDRRVLDLRMNHPQPIEPGNPCLQLVPISNLKAKVIQAGPPLAERQSGFRIVMPG